MSNRDNFSEKTKMLLRDRSGNRCAFPSCRAPTSGSSDESDQAIDSTGMACHIFAAAPGKGAKRYDPQMTPKQRKAPENGIWMCYKHGKQIDNDECRFTSDILFKWKELSEKLAQIENELGQTIQSGNERLSNLSLVSLELEIKENNPSLNSIIGDALRSSCASVIWGNELVQYIRGYLIERARNALTHGKADTVKINISAKKITLIDNGDNFTHQDLLRHPNARGGAETKQNLLERFGNKILSVSQRINNENPPVSG